MTRPAGEIRADLEHPHTAALTALHSTTIGDGPIGRLLRDVEPLLAEVELRRDAADERDRAATERESMRFRAVAAESKVRAVELLHVWTNEDGRRFVFADDLAGALGLPV